MLTIAVIGQDTLARATIECCEQHFRVTRDLTRDDLDVAWLCYDTPIRSDDTPDNGWVMQRLGEDISRVSTKTVVLISTQMPVGTTWGLEHRFPKHIIMHSPENIRVKTAVQDFQRQARIVVGRRTTDYDAMLHTLLSPFTEHLILTDPETAEMVKHALNCYLGMSIAFINEIARMSDVIGADVHTISAALLSERRISPHAPLLSGEAFGGGHLARDIHTIGELAKLADISLPIIQSITESNRVHREFTCNTDPKALY